MYVIKEDLYTKFFRSKKVKKKEIKKHQRGLGTIAVSRIYIIHVSQCELPTSLGNPSFNKKYYEVASLLKIYQ